jgi:hypothetical protein
MEKQIVFIPKCNFCFPLWGCIMKCVYLYKAKWVRWWFPSTLLCVTARTKCGRMWLGFYIYSYCGYVMCRSGGGYVGGDVPITMLKMGLCVTVYASFNCKTFLVNLQISNLSVVFSLGPLFAKCKIFMVRSIVLYACPVSSMCCMNFELCLLFQMSWICSLKRALNVRPVCPTYYITTIRIGIKSYSNPQVHRLRNLINLLIFTFTFSNLTVFL